MTPDRVCIVNDASVARGGATSLAILAACQLAARGVPVTYLCGDAGEAPELRAAGVELRALGAARLMQTGRARAAAQGIWNAAARAFLARAVAELDGPGTVWHLHGWAQILSPAAFAALAPVAARTVVHAHDMFLACPNGVYMDFPRGEVCGRVPLSAACLATNCDKRSRAQKGWRVLRQAALRRAFDQRRPWAAVAMIHPAMAERLTRGGVAARHLTTLRNPARPWSATRVPAEDNREVLFVGRLEPEKGVEHLAEAAAAAEMPLTIVGDGPMRADLARRFPGARFEGWRDRDAIGAIAARARVVVMASLIPEPFGLVAAEASLSGVPVILADSALMAPDFAEGGIGRAYPAGDSRALAAILAEMRDMDAAALRAISARAHARAVPLAETPESWTDGLLALYAGALRRAAA
jgi:glycosyltransferase involved in cell wall biosynthesis